MLLWWIVGILAILYLCRLYSKGKPNPYRRDMRGKVVIVSGGTIGIGKEAARDIAKMGAKVIVTGRDRAKAENTLRELNEEINDFGQKVEPVEFMKCDLCDLNEIKAFGEAIKARFDKIDVLVNNAGLMAANLKKTTQGIEQTIGANAVGALFLTDRLFPLLKKSPESRIVNVASGAYKLGRALQSKDKNGKVYQDDYLLENLSESDYNSFKAYAKSKLANIHYTNYLAALINNSNLSMKVCSLHPGAINSEISRDYSTALQIFKKIVIEPIMAITFRSEKEGAQTTIFCASCPYDKLVNGGYYYNCATEELSSWVKDSTLLAWTVTSEKIKSLTGLKIFEDIDK